MVESKSTAAAQKNKISSIRQKKQNIDSSTKKDIQKAAKAYLNYKATAKLALERVEELKRKLYDYIIEYGEFEPGDSKQQVIDFPGLGLVVGLTHPEDSLKINTEKALSLLPKDILARVVKEVVDEKELAKVIDERLLSSKLVARIMDAKKNSPRMNVKEK